MSVALPEFLKKRLRPLPQWSSVAVGLPQQFVQVRMVAGQAEIDVTSCSVVASLRPLTLAMGLSEPIISAIKRGAEPRLDFVDRQFNRTVGTLHLGPPQQFDAAGVPLALFEIRHGEQHCVRWPYGAWNSWLQNRAIRRNTNPNNFSMAPEAVQQMMIFYICPRPVVFVSVDDRLHSNIFPMDLIGAVSQTRFTLALRSTSQSIATMKTARKVALSDVAAQDRAIAYQLGAHHKQVQVDWEHLPFKIQRTSRYSLPYPDAALRIREIEILGFEDIGSHTFFVSRVVSEQLARSGEQLCHSSGIYQHFRSRQGRPLQPVP